MSDGFTEAETAELRANAITIFADRVVFDAQPPMPADQIAAVQALCNGDLPPDLIELWRLTAGGRLDYDLTLPMNGNRERISWAELFYNGSDGYRDLDGWIDAELDLAREAADARAGQPWSGTLDAVPFGGFEYTDRIYVVTDPEADDCGHVLAWKHGLPPAWHGALHDDGLAAVAPDLRTAFRRLHLETDPLEPDVPDGAGEELLDYVDDRRSRGTLSAPLAEKLIAFYRRAVIDWRTPLANGTLAAQPGLANTALRHAIERDDPALARQLASTGVDLGAPVAGSLTPVAFALRQRAYDTATALVEAGAPVPPDALESAWGAIPPTLITTLLAAGAQADADTMAQCVAYGAADSARLLGAALAERGLDAPALYAAASAALLQRVTKQTTDVRAGRLHHHLGLEGLETHAERLRTFVR